MSNFFGGTSSTNVSARTQGNEYDVLTKVSVRKHLLRRVRRAKFRETVAMASILYCIIFVSVENIRMIDSPFSLIISSSIIR